MTENNSEMCVRWNKSGSKPCPERLLYDVWCEDNCKTKMVAIAGTREDKTRISARVHKIARPFQQLLAYVLTDGSRMKRPPITRHVTK